MQYLSAKQLSTRYGVSLATIWRWRREGNYPDPVHLSARCTRWRLEDIEAWEQAQVIPESELPDGVEWLG